MGAEDERHGGSVKSSRPVCSVPWCHQRAAAFSVFYPWRGGMPVSSFLCDFHQRRSQRDPEWWERTLAMLPQAEQQRGAR